MSDRPVKCPTCGEFFRRSETVHIYDEKKKRYYHAECYDKGEAKIASDRENLYAFMCELFGYEYVVPRVRKQINEIMEEYKYTFKGIQLTLDYVYRIEKMDKEKANGGIGIVPYFYDDAGDFYKKKMDIWESKELNFEVVEIKVSTKKRVEKNKKLINIGGL